jgi:hypothetical protein
MSSPSEEKKGILSRVRNIGPDVLDVADVHDTFSQAVSDVTKANPILLKAHDILKRQTGDDEALAQGDGGSQTHSPLSLLNI